MRKATAAVRGPRSRGSAPKPLQATPCGEAVEPSCGGVSRHASVAAQIGSSPPSMETNMPSDIDPQSGFRLPLPRREDLDEAGRSAYDRAVTPGRTIAGLHGPAGVQLYSPKIAVHVAAINQYLRFEAGFTPRTREIAILTTARELDSQFETPRGHPGA